MGSKYQFLSLNLISMKKMKSILFVAAIAFGFISCKKDKFTTVPQISFNSITPNSFLAGTLSTDPNQKGPFLSIQLTDQEGDFGFSDGEDTSYVYIKNISIPPYDIDSLRFPSSSAIKRKNLDAEVIVDLFNTHSLLVGTPNPSPKPFIDTLRFEVYVVDFAKNKSNVIVTKPLYYITE